MSASARANPRAKYTLTAKHMGQRREKARPATAREERERRWTACRRAPIAAPPADRETEEREIIHSLFVFSAPDAEPTPLSSLFRSETSVD